MWDCCSARDRRRTGGRTLGRSWAFGTSSRQLVLTRQRNQATGNNSDRQCSVGERMKAALIEWNKEVGRNPSPEFAVSPFKADLQLGRVAGGHGGGLVGACRLGRRGSRRRARGRGRE